jgi:hypothetical protein
VVGVDPLLNAPTDPSLPGGHKYFNPAAFVMPRVPAFGEIQLGNAGNGVMYGPAWTNFDLSLSREIPLGGERRKMRLRLEAFNVFNSAQFQGVDSSYTFNAATGVNTRASTGNFTSSHGPRLLSLELRFEF